ELIAAGRWFSRHLRDSSSSRTASARLARVPCASPPLARTAVQVSLVDGAPRPPRCSLEPQGMLQALVVRVVRGKRGDLRPLDREIRVPAERPQGLHEDFVPLEVVDRLAERCGQTGDAATAQLLLAQGRRIHVDGLAGVALSPDAVEARVDEPA